MAGEQTGDYRAASSQLIGGLSCSDDPPRQPGDRQLLGGPYRGWYHLAVPRLAHLTPAQFSIPATLKMIGREKTVTVRKLQTGNALDNASAKTSSAPLIWQMSKAEEKDTAS